MVSTRLETGELIASCAVSFISGFLAKEIVSNTRETFWNNREIVRDNSDYTDLYYLYSGVLNTGVHVGKFVLGCSIPLLSGLASFALDRLTNFPEFQDLTAQQRAKYMYLPATLIGGAAICLHPALDEESPLLRIGATITSIYYTTIISQYCLDVKNKNHLFLNRKISRLSLGLGLAAFAITTIYDNAKTGFIAGIFAAFVAGLGR